MLQNSISWEIEQHPVFSNGSRCQGYKAITRSDNGALLNVAKKSYTPTTNARLTDVAEQLSELTGFKLEGYDTFASGKKVLAYLKNTEGSKVCDFAIDDYMVIGNSHDYSTGFFIGTSTVMLRCENQFSRINRQMKVQHTRSSEKKIDELIMYFKNYIAERDRLLHRMEDFSKVKIDDQIIAGLMNRLLNMEGEEISTRKANLVTDMNRSITRELADLGNNALGLFHGITHYTTHVKKSKDQCFGNILGSLATINEKAFNYCNELVLA